MTNRAATGYSWRSETVVIYSTPSGCKHTGQAVPIGNAARDGISVCPGAKFGASGAAILQDPNINYCELWMLVNNVLTTRLHFGGVLNNQYVFSAPDYGSTAYTIGNTTSTLSLAILFRYNNESVGSALRGGVLETDITVNVYSMESDPVVTVRDSQSFYAGDRGNCGFGNTGTCAFSKNTNVRASIMFQIQGGSQEGTDIVATVSSFGLSGWIVVKSEHVGVKTTGTWSAELDFTFPGSGLLGTRYQMDVSYTSVFGGLKVVRGSESTLHQTTVIDDPCTGCLANCTDYTKCPNLNPCLSCTANQTCTNFNCVDKPVIPISEPVAKITPDKTSGKTPLVVSFKESNVVTGMTSGKLTYGDGVSESLMQGSVSHTYTKSGVYRVSYIVTNSVGSSTSTTTITVEQGTDTPITDPCFPCSAACTNKLLCPSTPTDPCSPCTSACTNKTLCPSVVYNPCSPCTSACTNKTLCPPGSVAKSPCVGLNRDGSLDPTCIIEKGNENYLYMAIGAVVLLLLLKKR